MCVWCSTMMRTPIAIPSTPVMISVASTPGIPPYPFSRRCLWDVLWESGLRLTTDWSIFYHQTWPGPNVPTGPGKQCFTQLMIDSLQKYEDKFFRKIDDLYRILNRAANTQLPTFSYIEPCWNIDYLGTSYQNGNDYHPGTWRAGRLSSRTSLPSCRRHNTGQTPC